MTFETEQLDCEVQDKIIVTGRTPCVCGCRRDLHCTGDPIMHWPNSGGALGYYFCLVEHCTGMKMVNGKHIDCECLYYRASESDAPKLKRPRANDFTACANPSCGHWRSHHCKKRPAPKKISKKFVITDSGCRKYDSDKWTGFEDERGNVAPCKHTPQDASQTYRCTSTSCAEEGCPCDNWVNPLARSRAKATSPHKSKKKAKVEVQMNLFPSEEIGRVRSAS